MSNLSISAYTLTNALGAGVKPVSHALLGNQTGLRPNDFHNADLKTWIGRVDGLKEISLPSNLAHFDCRNNRLALHTLRQDDFEQSVHALIDHYGADRIGLFLGTSTSGIHSTELAYERREGEDAPLPAEYQPEYTHNIHSAVAFVSEYFGLTGIAQSVSTACSSSAKVFAAAHRAIEVGLCDAALVGGVDSLCLTTLYGFNSLELVSAEPCKPWDANRNGISIGEGAGFALLEKKQGRESTSPLLLGYGESCDAYHMSTPHPDGLGAKLAMEQALSMAGLMPQDIDYINLHGTGTPSNDAAEDNAVSSLFSSDTPCSSTKGWVGHTLGAAGITEALFSLIFMEQGFMPPMLNLLELDPALSANILTDQVEHPLRSVLSNSFGFGGNNCSLIFGQPT